MWPLKSIILENWALFWVIVNKHLWSFQRRENGKMFIFRVNLGICPLNLFVLEKLSPVLRVSTHIYGVSKDIDGKMFIFRVNQGMWLSNQIISAKRGLFW